MPADPNDWAGRSISAEARRASLLTSVRLTRDEARAAATAGLALNPTFTIRRFRNSASSDNPTYLAQRERVIDGMRKAGVPEE